MKERKKIFWLLGLAVLFLQECLFPLHAGAASKKYLSLGTGNPGGTYYFIGAGFASIFNKYVPTVRVIAESTAAAEENFNLIMRKKMDLAISSCNPIKSAAEKKTDFSNIRLMAMGHTSDQHWFVRKGSPVKSIGDFRNRRVTVGQPGSGTLIMARWVLEACGITLNDLKPAYLSFSESVTAIKDDTVDVGLIAAGYPVASILDLSRQIPLRLIPYTQEELNAVFNKIPYLVKIVIPSGTYTGIATDTQTHGSPAYLACRSDMSEEMIYLLTKALFEHAKEKDAIHPQARQWSLETAFRGADFVTQHFPFHPGAVKYYQEKGVWKGR
jgi:TRAP transporter TAXI family solute receptor